MGRRLSVALLTLLPPLPAAADEGATLTLPIARHTLVVARPLRGTIRVDLRPTPGLDLAALRRAHPAVADIAAYPLPRSGIRLAIALHRPSRVKVARDGESLELSFAPLDGAIALGAILYPWRRPATAAQAPSPRSCPDVVASLDALRSGRRRWAARRLARAMRWGGACGAAARLGLAEAALMLEQNDLAVEILQEAPRSRDRDRMLADAAFRAGDFALASDTFSRLGPAASDPRVGAEAHLCAGRLGAARRWLEAARRASPGQAAEISLRLADVDRLAGGSSSAVGRVAAPSEPFALWRRAAAAYAQGRWAQAQSEATALVRGYPRSPFAAAARDLRRRALVEWVRASRDDAALALRYLRAPGRFSGEALGPELCARAEAALARLGLVVAAAGAGRRCLPLHRAAGREREALMRLAEMRRLAGDEAGRLRTLRYLAARDPLGAARDAAFWRSYGEALGRAGRFAEAARALRRAVRSGDASARLALGALLVRVGHVGAGRLLLGDAGGGVDERTKRALEQEWAAVAAAVRALEE